MLLTKRLPYVNADLSKRVLESRLRSILETEDLIRSEPGKREQIRSVSLAREYQSAAMSAYALGYPLGDVRHYLSRAVAVYSRVFELRGTESPFPVLLVELDRNGGPASTRSKYREGEKDFSVTNSRKSFHAACLGWISGESDLAKTLALSAWDPPGASYVGPGSSCTRNDQRLAYALRDALNGDEKSALALLAGVGPQRGEHTNVLAEAKMLRGIISFDPRVFLEGVAEMLAWHPTMATRESLKTNTDFFICVPALGLSALAVSRNLVRTRDLPKDDMFFPLELPPIMSGEQAATDNETRTAPE